MDINLTGGFWGMPVNLTLFQETIPWFEDPAWWSVIFGLLGVIFGIPAVLVALKGLRGVESNLNRLAVSIKEVRDYKFGIDVTRKDDTQKDAEPKYRKLIYKFITKTEDKKAKLKDVESKDTEPIYEFISKLKGKKVNISLVSGGGPITGILISYSPNAILIKTSTGEILVYNHSIAAVGTGDSFDERI